jgi:hypothetical protein
MSRLSPLDDDQLTPEFREKTKAAEASGDYSALWRVLGHRAELIDGFFKWYEPMHNGGVLDPVIKELVRLRIAGLNQCLT